MHTTRSCLLSSKPTVTFEGVEWEVQKEKQLEKCRQGAKKKKKKRDKKSRNPIIIALRSTNEKEELRRFLGAASNLEDVDKAKALREMDSALLRGM